jgi:flagellar P-ring protein precursor FlgI
MMKRLRSATAITAAAVVLTFFATTIAYSASAAGAAAPASPTVGDLVRVRGIRSNQLVGLGLVVGLRETGDPSAATAEAVRRLEAACGFEAVCESGDAPAARLSNAALVVVTAEFPAFAAEGARVDVTVSAAGDAASVSGGTLVATPLRAGRGGEVYVRAQGAVSSGDPARPATVGIVYGGGIVERAAPPVALEAFRARMAEGRITLDLKGASAEAARAVARAVNRPYGAFADAIRARAVTPGEVEVAVAPELREDAIGLLADVLALPVDLAPPARIVVNERLGTVAASGRIMIGPASVATGALLVTIGDAPGAAADAPNADAGFADRSRPLVSLEEGVTLEELVRELRGIRTTSQDIIGLLRGLVRVGALRAEIIVE